MVFQMIVHSFAERLDSKLWNQAQLNNFEATENLGLYLTLDWLRKDNLAQNLMQLELHIKN